ncbi:MAG: UDP-glucose 4-epimerase GalE [bacterium]
MNKNNPILITGGAGYIGSHTAWAAIDAGYDIIIIDDLSTGCEQSVPYAAKFIKGDISDLALLRRIISDYHIKDILHFAGRIVVPESVEYPIKYYQENTVQTLNLLELCVTEDIENFIFSSTAAVYAPPSPSTPNLTESSELRPLSPYGQSKLMSEQMIRDIGTAHGLNSAILRYFNVAGADPHGRTGQSTPNATHLIKVACQTALGQRACLKIFGDDYDTPDGTCIRDYIHVSDLARAHILALEKLHERPGQYTMNCGYNQGVSVKQVVAAVERVTGKKLPVEYGARRAGDAPALVADNTCLLAALNWQSEHCNLEKMIASALRWEESLLTQANNDQLKRSVQC